MYIQDVSESNAKRLNIANNGDISFYDSTGVTQGLFWDASTQRLGLGTTSPVATLEVDGSTTLTGGGTGTIHVNIEDSSLCPTMTFTRNGVGTTANGFLKFENSGGQVAEINATGGGYFLGNVGIGTDSPAAKLEVLGSDDANNLIVGHNDTDFAVYTDSTVGEVRLKAEDGSGGNFSKFMSFYTQPSGSSAAERMRIDSNGNLLVGKTSTASNVVGAFILNNGLIRADVDGGAVNVMNRKTSDGDIAVFQKNGTTVGIVGTTNKGGVNEVYFGTGDTGLYYRAQSDAITPCTTADGSDRDNAIDLGFSSIRFDDIYATNGTIQTSDANEKQQIASLTDAEITAAKAISALFKTFKWNDSVTEKGDAARTHTGVIAQDVQQAMTDAGLDAGDYAFFISSTWWETQTDVPAVEAVAEVLDEDGNVVTEAVEAQEAYTRTDTYDTAEEAPEGAIERTRLGVRYPELLAFIGAATEQRLANIETRLAALEAN
jgi:hypothetical protein